MWTWIFKISIFLLVIYLGHISWDYCKNNLSKPKTKDLVNIQTEKYRNIIQELTSNMSVLVQMPVPVPMPVPPPTQQSIPQLGPSLGPSLEPSLEQELELQMDLEQFMTEL